ncbi:MFS transporter [Marinivivus vitaminiproducens]|uniref:MFS transporter n=1 Tax=Marinivivus vitaminiproducens TaxID=3035935 RepID=UPI0027A0210C|nr:MFS transporter [Geminicoccaceae bacterium SCSIO 64248]
MSPNLRYVLPGFALIAVTYGLARFAYGVFLPAIREDVALSPSLSGLIGGGSYAGYCLAIVASALVAERLGPRATAALAGLVAAIGMAAIALAPSPWLLAAAVLLAGMSTGLASPPLAEAVAMRIAPEGQGRANTIINSGTSAGVVLSGPVALAATGAWREAYLVFAVLAAGVTVWVWMALPMRGGRRDGAAPDLSWSVLGRPAARPLVLAAFGMGAASAAYWTFAGEIVREVGGLSPSVANTAWVVVGVSGFAGAAAGDLVRRFGISAVNRTALALLGTAIVSLGALPGHVASAYGAAGLFGAAYIMLTGVYLVWGVRVFSDRPAIGLGLPFLMVAIGQAVGAPIAGGLIGTIGYAMAFAAFAAVALLAMLATPPAVANLRACSA